MTLISFRRYDPDILPVDKTKGESEGLRKMLKVLEIIKKHHKKLEREIMEAIAEYDVDPEPRIRFVDIPSYAISKEYELQIGDKEHSYTLSIALLSGEDQRSKQIEEALKEIGENPGIQFH
jgi:hypothetical protein